MREIRDWIKLSVDFYLWEGSFWVGSGVFNYCQIMLLHKVIHHHLNINFERKSNMNYIYIEKNSLSTTREFEKKQNMPLLTELCFFFFYHHFELHFCQVKILTLFL